MSFPERNSEYLEGGMSDQKDANMEGSGASPNVVFIFTDQHRHDMLSCVGKTPVRTPHLDSLAQSGVRFTQARCTTPLCMPSRTTYFTGRYARRNGSLDNEIKMHPGGDHLATRLREAGYQMALAGKNHAFTDEELKGWDFVELYAMHGKEEKSFCSPARDGESAIARWRKETVPFFESAIHEAQPGDPEDDPTVAQTEYALSFLRSQEKDSSSPFFLWLSYEAPHFPYVLPEPWFSASRLGDMPGLIDDVLWKESGPCRLRLQHAGLRMDEMSDRDIRRVQASYCGMIEMVDEQVGRVLDCLEAQGLRENTIVVFASDHGDFWGHRGLVGKTNAVYEDLLRVPTIWSLPGHHSGRTTDAMVENTDFAPTLIDILGLSKIESVQGASYAKVLRGESDQHRKLMVAESSLGRSSVEQEGLLEAISRRDELMEEEGCMWFVNRIGGMTRSLFRPPWKLITHELDPPELFNLSEDPLETKNLAGGESVKEIQESLSRELEKISLG